MKKEKTKIISAIASLPYKMEVENLKNKLESYKLALKAIKNNSCPECRKKLFP